VLGLNPVGIFARREVSIGDLNCLWKDVV